jgi:hypothetical protein
MLMFSPGDTIRKIWKHPALPALTLMGSAFFFAASSYSFLAESRQKLAYVQILDRQLAASRLQYEKLRTQAREKQLREQAIQEATATEQQEHRDYYDSVPLVVSTLDGKGKLVGFSRLRESGGTSQYSFQIKIGVEKADVTGTITNAGNQLAYSDDYSTPDQARTSGEVVHSKSRPGRLSLIFVVTSTSSDKYSVGDTFSADFVIPGSTASGRQEI